MPHLFLFKPKKLVESLNFRIFGGERG